MARELRNILDAVLDGVLIIDGAGRVEEINAEGCRLLESSDEALRGQALERVLGPQHPLVSLVRRVEKTGQAAIQDDLELEQRFEEAIPVDVEVSPLEDEHSQHSSGVVVVFRDRTISNSLRQEVAQREQLTSYGHFAAGIAHEVKNPLGGIRGAAELIGRVVDDERASRYAELIVGEVDRITELVEELMVFARGDELDIAPLNLHQVLDGVIELIRMDPLASGRKIERRYDPSIPEILGDDARLKQIFLNLMRNGLQAMENLEGDLHVETRMTLDQRITGPDGHGVPTVQVRIVDQGAGIPKDILDKLATPFFTTRVEGTGLGLAISHHWIARHHGSMRITSDPGQGTCVRVNIPLITPVHDRHAGNDEK